MGISKLAQMMRRDDYDLSKLTTRDTMDAIGAVLAYCSRQWYDLEYADNDKRWYWRGMRFLEDHYAKVAREAAGK